MRNQQFIALSYALLLITFLFGCEEPGNVGSGLVDEPVEIHVVDTLTVKSSTVFMDSVETQGSGVILTGSYNDKFLGRITTKGYFKLSLGGKFNVDKSSEYDSLRLYMNKTYHYGEADQTQQITAHRVREDIEPSDDNIKLYNFDNFTFDQEVLGQTSFIPDEDNEIEMAISDQLGQDLFEAAQNEDDVVSIQEDFQDYIKGLVLIGDDHSGTAITGFEAGSTENIILRLFYTDKEDEISEQRHHDFSLVPSSSFSNITGSHPPPLDQLTEPHQEISSSKTGNKVFLQSGVGLMTRLEFPTIDKLFDISSNFVLNGANLYLIPRKDTYKSATTPLPQSLVIHVADEYNRILGSLSDGQGNLMKTNPVIDNEFNRNTYYKFDITSFIQNELNTDRYTDRGLLLAPANNHYTNSVNRIIAGDTQNPEFKLLFELVLTELKLK